jgi:hypothetical protein
VMGMGRCGRRDPFHMFGSKGAIAGCHGADTTPLWQRDCPFTPVAGGNDVHSWRARAIVLTEESAWRGCEPAALEGR